MRRTSSIAQDNLTNQKICLAILRKHVSGGQVAVACNGLEAVEAARQGRFDVILMVSSCVAHRRSLL